MTFSPSKNSLEERRESSLRERYERAWSRRSTRPARVASSEPIEVGAKGQASMKPTTAAPSATEAATSGREGSPSQASATSQGATRPAA